MLHFIQNFSNTDQGAFDPVVTRIASCLAMFKAYSYLRIALDGLYY